MIREGLRLAMGAMGESARLLSHFVPDRMLGAEAAELSNKLWAFKLFHFAKEELRFRADATLSEAQTIAASKESFESIWMMEGAVYHFARAGANLSEAEIPKRYYVPLHAGMGMAYAEEAVEKLSGNPGQPELRTMIESIVEKRRKHSRPGWDVFAVEPLGLVIRLLRPRLLHAVSDAMGALDPEFRGLYWHGVGRSIYFTPSAMIPAPGTHDRALAMALREAPEPADKRNAVAGYSWAVTLVNLRQPRAVSSLLARAVGRGVCGAFSNGFASALMAWKHMSPPNERFIEPYLHAVPGPCPPSVWEKFASVPARAAFETIYPGLLRNNTVAKIFAYRTTSELKHLASAKEETTLETCQ